MKENVQENSKGTLIKNIVAFVTSKSEHEYETKDKKEKKTSYHLGLGIKAKPEDLKAKYYATLQVSAQFLNDDLKKAINGSLIKFTGYEKVDTKDGKEYINIQAAKSIEMMEGSRMARTGFLPNQEIKYSTATNKKTGEVFKTAKFSLAKEVGKNEDGSSICEFLNCEAVGDKMVNKLKTMKFHDNVTVIGYDKSYKAKEKVTLSSGQESEREVKRASFKVNDIELTEKKFHKTTGKIKKIEEKPYESKGEGKKTTGKIKSIEEKPYESKGEGKVFYMAHLSDSSVPMLRISADQMAKMNAAGTSLVAGDVIKAEGFVESFETKEDKNKIQYLNCSKEVEAEEKVEAKVETKEETKKDAKKKPTSKKRGTGTGTKKTETVSKGLNF